MMFESALMGMLMLSMLAFGFIAGVNARESQVVEHLPHLCAMSEMPSTPDELANELNALDLRAENCE
jgi:hypothetical protein